MAWIESHQGLKDHPKTRRLTRLLSISLPAAIGHLHCFWWWALDYAQDGDLSKYDAFDIADACMWDGAAESFVEALTEAGFVKKEQEKIIIHDWMDYAGRLIDRRQRDAERKRKEREVQGTSDGQRAESVVTVPKPYPNPNQDIKDYSTQIYDLRGRYSPDQLKTIDEYFSILRWTRKGGKIADSVILKIYIEWEKFKPEVVIHALRTYIKNPAYHDKQEAYCYGIMRNTKASEVVAASPQGSGYTPKESY